MKWNSDEFDPYPMPEPHPFPGVAAFVGVIGTLGVIAFHVFLAVELRLDWQVPLYVLEFGFVVFFAVLYWQDGRFQELARLAQRLRGHAYLTALAKVPDRDIATFIEQHRVLRLVLKSRSVFDVDKGNGENLKLVEREFCLRLRQQRVDLLMNIPVSRVLVLEGISQE